VKSCGVEFSNPYTAIDVWVATYTLPLTTVGTVNFTGLPASSEATWLLL